MDGSAGFGTLSADEYFGGSGKAPAAEKSGSVALLHAPGGLAASNAGADLAELIRGFAPYSAEALIPEQFKQDIITHRRENNDARFIMLASQNGVSADTKVVFRNCPAEALFYELDLETGAVYSVTAEKTGNGFVIDAPLTPWSARIFAAARRAHPAGAAETGISAIQALTRPPEKTVKLELNLEKAMKVSIAGDNVYRLEDLTVSIGGGPAFASKPNTFIEHFRESGSFRAGQIKFSDGFGLPQRLSVNYPIPAAYHFEFTLSGDFVPAKVFLMRDRMAIMGEHSITVNGRELPASAFKPCHVYDQNNIAADVAAYLSGGLNAIDVNLTAARDWDGVSDPMFLLGDFGVLRRDGKFTIGKSPLSAVPTAKAVEGYPFYSGKFTFETELRIENLNGSGLFTIEIPERYRIYECVELSINGHELGVRTFSPYVWQGDVSRLKKGENQVTLTIANTLGNILEGCYYDYEAQRTVYIKQ
jgi:hypothetical protein